jgi:ABC-type polysaccharide/polyol phosphate transport system ATPase subunit
MVRDLCDRAIWLDHGEVVMTGRVSELLDAYAGAQQPRLDVIGPLGIR